MSNARPGTRPWATRLVVQRGIRRQSLGGFVSNTTAPNTSVRRVVTARFLAGVAALFYVGYKRCVGLPRGPRSRLLPFSLKFVAHVGAIC